MSDGSSMYTNARLVCKQIIERNLSTDNFLSIKQFKNYHMIMDSYSGLKFYQYCSPSDRRIDQFDNNIFSCSNPLCFNDIFEGMVVAKDEIERASVREMIKKACNAVFIGCFSESWDNLLMNAHYSASFTGFCLEYDYTRMRTHFPYLYFFPVIYQDHPSALAKIIQLGQDIDQVNAAIATGKLSFKKIDDVISYFIHKADIWEYEREWRLIIPVTQYENFGGRIENDYFLLIENFDCVSAVYLGANITDENKEKILEIVRRKNADRRRSTSGLPEIEVYETGICQDSYKLISKKVAL